MKMKINKLVIFFSFLFFLALPQFSFAEELKTADNGATPAVADKGPANAQAEDNPTVDPFEPFNRLFFQFNDKLYYWALRPVSKTYAYLVPEWGRVRVRNIFRNITMPVRFVNSLLQFKVNGAARELGHFVVNSTVGVAGMFEIPWDTTEPKVSDEDLGQTLGSYGVGEGFYIVLPVLGPSNLRDSVGLAGDLFLDPVNYVTPNSAAIEIHGYDRVNGTSLRIGDYEELIESAVDPYTAVKDAYTQNRRSRIKE